MGRKLKSNEVILAIAKQLKQRRCERELTLKELERHTGVNCGQISRFEKGNFKTVSENLQIVCTFFQIHLPLYNVTVIPVEDSIGRRFEKFASLSAVHYSVAEDILRAFDRLK
jgi:transcriptional regulator with XRE-family HTH domain